MSPNTSSLILPTVDLPRLVYLVFNKENIPHQGEECEKSIGSKNGFYGDVSGSQKTSKSHFTIGSDPIESKALYYHYLDLPILRTSADLKYYHSHLVDFFLIVLHLSDHVIIGCRHPGCLTAEYTFIFIAIFSYLLCFTFSSVLKSVLPFVLVQF